MTPGNLSRLLFAGRNGCVSVRCSQFRAPIKSHDKQLEIADANGILREYDAIARSPLLSSTSAMRETPPATANEDVVTEDRFYPQPYRSLAGFACRKLEIRICETCRSRHAQ